MRVFAIARQSRGDVKSESTEEQLAKLGEWCELHSHELVGHAVEQDISGGRAFAKRPGLVAAVEAVERGDADAVVARDITRLFRNLAVQIPFLKRVEQAGGKVQTINGDVSRRGAAKTLQSTILGAFAEYEREQTAERVRETHERLVAEGKWVGAKVPIGYAIAGDGRLVPDDHAPAVLEAYRMRDRGASLEDVRTYLREVTRLPIPSLNIVQRMLRNPVYLGWVVREAREKGAERGWPDLVNRRAHEAIVPADLHRRVSGLNAPRGRRPSSDRLLARLGVLRCGECGSRMVVASATGSRKQRVPVYRCPPGNACTTKQSVTARIAEEVVVHATRLALTDAEGRTGGDTKAATSQLERAKAAFDQAVQAFDGFEDAASVRDKLAGLKADVEAAEDALERARRSASFTIKPGLNWDELTLDERRDLIRVVIDRAEVAQGKGKERVVVTVAPELGDVQRVLDHAAESFRDELPEADVHISDI